MAVKSAFDKYNTEGILSNKDYSKIRTKTSLETVRFIASQATMVLNSPVV